MSEPVYVCESSITDQALLYLLPEMRYFGVWSKRRGAFEIAYPGAVKVEKSYLLDVAWERRRRVALAEMDTNRHQ